MVHQRLSRLVRLPSLLVVLALGLSACAPSPAAAPGPSTSVPAQAVEDEAAPATEVLAAEAAVAEAAVAETAVAEMMDAEVMEPAGDDSPPTSEAGADTTTAEAVPVPAWQTIPLTDAVTGDEFTVADFAGKTIFVEPFATWCSNCRRQLGTVDGLRAQSGDDVVFLALSVETNVGNEALANYAAQTGYGLIFAAMPPEMLQLLVDAYGQGITNPPATPHFVIGPDGASSELFTGFRSAADIQAIFAAAGG